MENSPILNDYVFKQVFGQRNDNPVLISFLKAVLNRKPLIKSIEMLNAELVRDFPKTKTVILDTKAKCVSIAKHKYIPMNDIAEQIEDGTYVDIEVQTKFARAFELTKFAEV